MLQSLLLILLIIGAIWAYMRFQSLPPQQRRKALLRGTLTGVALLMVLMVAFGRLPWFFALIGALLPFLRGLFGIGMTVLPLWLRHKQQSNQTQREQPQHPPRSGDMTVKEAADILGLKTDLIGGDLTEELVNAAHRRLIQKVHPDRGGNDYLAAKINLARDVLLSNISKSG